MLTSFASGQLQQKKNFSVNEYEHSKSMIRANSMILGVSYLNVYDAYGKQVKAIKFFIKQRVTVSIIKGQRPQRCSLLLCKPVKIEQTRLPG